MIKSRRIDTIRRLVKTRRVMKTKRITKDRKDQWKSEGLIKTFCEIKVIRIDNLKSISALHNKILRVFENWRYSKKGHLARKRDLLFWAPLMVFIYLLYNLSLLLPLLDFSALKITWVSHETCLILLGFFAIKCKLRVSLNIVLTR